MDHQPAEHPGYIQRIVRSEDTRIGVFAGWYLGLTVFPVGGFYLFTIASNASDANGIAHYYDLRVADMHIGGAGALLGLALGIALGLWMTFVYPKLKEKEDAWDESHGEHHEIYPETELEHH